MEDRSCFSRETKMNPNFIGHQKTYQKLLDLHQSGRLPHALLFLGPEGIGKQRVARQLARQILKAEPSSPEDPPLEATHPDFILLEPEGGRIKIDTIREIKKNLNYAPLKGESRVVLMTDAHTMNAAAANALLKSLEEPPPGTFFILVTHALGWLPRTIVSRSQKILFPPLNPSEMMQVLQKLEVEIPEEMISWAQGSPLKALQLAEVQEGLPSLEDLFPSPKALGFDGAQSLSQAVTDEEAIPAFLGGLLASTHHCLTSSQPGHPLAFDLLHFSDRILEIRNLLRQNINPKIHLTRLLLHFQEPLESRL